MKIAAIDQGTTSTRVLLANDGDAAIVHAVRHRQFYPHPGWVEHDPAELLTNMCDCIAACGPIDAIGVDNQGESCLAWDAMTGAPLSPVIVWQDNRTAELVERMKAEGIEPEVLARAGLPLDPYFSASKLAWLLRNLPPVRAAYDAGRLRLGTTDAFFLDRLTGHFATDATTASRTSLMNIATGEWDCELCRLFGVPQECLPQIRPTTGSFGDIDGVPVTCSVVDQQAALYGHGCREPGDAKITFGTGAFALAVTGDAIVRAPEQGLLPTIAWKTREATVRAVDGGVYDAGSAVDWAGRLGLYGDVSELDAFDAPAAIGRGLIFVPALSGLACPHWDRSAAALWLGMSAETTKRDLCQALLEGIALRTAEVIDALDRHVPISGRLSVDGGLTGSSYFCQFLADMLGREIVTRRFNELTAVGTAELASVGAGNSMRLPVGIARTFRPGSAEREEMRAKFQDGLSRSRAWR